MRTASLGCHEHVMHADIAMPTQLRAALRFFVLGFLTDIRENQLLSLRKVEKAAAVSGFFSGVLKEIVRNFKGTTQTRPRPFLSSSRAARFFNFGISLDAAPNALST